MNYQLIMLPKPILVSDEEIKEGDYFYYKHFGEDIINVVKQTTDLININNPDRYFKKIIAGIPELPRLDLSLIPDELGYVDVVRLANIQFDEDTKKIPVPSQLWYDSQDAQFNSFIKGFNASPKKYTEEDIIDFLGFYSRTATLGFGSTGENNHLNAKQLVEAWEKQRQLKVYNVEVEMEIIRQNQCINKCASYPSACLCEMTKHPKITNNTIKVIKIL